jgi:hypothetical protein
MSSRFESMCGLVMGTFARRTSSCVLHGVSSPFRRLPALSSGHPGGSLKLRAYQGGLLL